MPSDRPVTPVPAASLILLREHDGRCVVLLGRRRKSLRFMPGFHVFPGGKLDPVDSRNADQIMPSIPEVTGLIDVMSAKEHAAHIHAALRECREETGIELSDATPPLPAHIRYIAQAVTPDSSPLRFNTRFFLADGTKFTATGTPSGELEDVGWYDSSTAATSLAMADVTEFALNEALAHWYGKQAQTAYPPVLTYENGRAIITKHKEVTINA